MSLGFRGNFVKLYPVLDRRFTYSMTPSLHISIKRATVFSSNIKLAVDRRCFTIKKNCCYLISMSDDLDENVKSGSNVDSHV